VLATLSKFSDFVLVLQATTRILILRFQEMVTPGVACDCGVLATLTKKSKFCDLGFSVHCLPSRF
jgi:hypothetical protein